MLNKILSFIEKRAAALQGKGWGTSTVQKEFACAASLFRNKDPLLCIDIGGNHGIYSAQILTKHPTCDVVIFEPAKSNVDILTEKFSTFDNVTIEQKAVSNADGGATLFSNEDGSGLASLTKRRLDHLGIAFDTTESIETITFEHYWQTRLGSRAIDLCKIDIEGHELDALAGFGAAIEAIDVIQFEFGGCNIDTRTFFQDFWYFFEDKGFDLYRISRFGLAHVSKYQERDEFFSTTNYIAKRKGG